MNSDFLNLLVCPISGNLLSHIDSSHLETINYDIQSKRVVKINGENISLEITSSLIDSSNNYIYPIIDSIIVLKKDEALIYRNTVAEKYINAVDYKKLGTQDFYNTIGWEKENDNFKDALLFEDLRPVSSEYIKKCHYRLKRYIPHAGKYIVDVASGPIQYDEYLSYSENYDFRICIDISMAALIHAKRRLKEKGIYVLADITNLPFKNNSVDAAVSLHTIYHIPREEQVKAFNELHRIIKPGKSAVVVYSWGNNSDLMKLINLPQRIIGYIKRRYLSLNSKNISANSDNEANPILYVHNYDYSFFKKSLTFNYKISVWRSVSVPFLRKYIYEYLGGKYILKFIFFMEEKFPELLGKIGQYPIFIIMK